MPQRCRPVFTTLIVTLGFWASSLTAASGAADRDGLDIVSAIKSLKWRSIGPANMGGRVTDIVGIPGDAKGYYLAGADGGVFKTTNGGVTFEALFEDQRAFSVGALAIAASDPEVIWLGSGEGDPRNSVGYGNGVYRSVDGGRTRSRRHRENQADRCRSARS